MIKRSIARRYARALMDLAGDEPQPIAEDLEAFAELVRSNSELSEVLSNPGFSLEERRKVLQRLQAQKPLRSPLDRFVDLLVTRHRANYLSAVAECFRELVDEREGRVRVEVLSAVALDSAAQASLEKVLADGLGKRVVLEQRVEPALLAGVQVRVGGRMLDGSLRGQLERLKEKLARKRS